MQKWSLSARCLRMRKLTNRLLVLLLLLSSKFMVCTGRWAALIWIDLVDNHVWHNVEFGFGQVRKIYTTGGPNIQPYMTEILSKGEIFGVKSLYRVQSVLFTPCNVPTPTSLSWSQIRSGKLVNIQLVGLDSNSKFNEDYSVQMIEQLPQVTCQRKKILVLLKDQIEILQHLQLPSHECLCSRVHHKHILANVNICTSG
jgi:hypothetical protein